MIYYKVLVNGRSCHGGDCEYALPMQREDGTWEPGEWMPEIQGQLMLCGNGYHLTREPARWWREGAECYVAEWDGEYVGDGDGGDKIAVRRCRLLRRLTAAELASLRVFVEGSHHVSDGIAWASGFAQVKASGSAQVWASGSAQVWASGSAWVKAYDSAQVWASGSATVWAHDSARVWARGSARVEASGSAWVKAYDSAQVWASGSAQVEAYDSAQVEAYGFALVRTPRGAWGQPTVMTSGAAVWVDHRSGAPVVHTAEGRCEPVASGG